jgi:hypothetical protein
MIIKVDKEGAAFINKLCDVTLRATGINSLQMIMIFLARVELLPVEPPAVPPEPSEKDPIQHIIKV